MRVASHRPMRHPNKLVATSAVDAPANTIQGAWDSAVISKVATWVLSPISDKKMVKKVEPNTAAVPSSSFLVG